MDELPSYCSKSRDCHDLCSSREFWLERFAEEKIPLLQEGHDFPSWYRLYLRSILAAHYADEKVGEYLHGDNILLDDLDLEDVPRPSVVQVDGVPLDVISMYSRVGSRTGASPVLKIYNLDEEGVLYRLQAIYCGGVVLEDDFFLTEKEFWLLEYKIGYYLRQ